MKALVYYGPSDMKLAEYEKPVPKKGEVLLKSKAVGICGSDVHGYLGLTGRRIPPMIMGHEVVALVEETTLENSRYQKGDLVFVDPIITCKTCENCQEGYYSICLNKSNIGVLEVDGAFCEYFIMVEENLIPMPDGVRAEVGVLAEPFSVALHAVKQLTMPAGKVNTIAVIGAGVIGMCTAAVAKDIYRDAKIVIMDVAKKRLDRCHKILGGAVETQDLTAKSYEDIRDAYTSSGFDIVLEAVGVGPTVNGSLTLVKSKGEVVLIGNNQKDINLYYQQIVTRELRVYGTYGFTHRDLEESILKFKDRSYAASMVDKIVPLEEAVSYFDELANPDNDYLKIIVDPTL